VFKEYIIAGITFIKRSLEEQTPIATCASNIEQQSTISRDSIMHVEKETMISARKEISIESA